MKESLKHMKKERQIVSYVAQNQPVTAYCIKAKKALGFALKPIKEYNRLGYKLMMLWWMGHLEAVKINNKWNYYVVEE